MTKPNQRAPEPDELREPIPAVEGLFRAYLSETPDVIWVKDHEFRYRYVNRAFETLFAKTAHELLGHEDFEFLPEATAQQLRDNDRRVCESGEALNTFEVLAGADGRTRRWAVTKFPLPQPDETIWIGGKATDITESIEAEENYRLLVEASPFCIHRIDKDGRLLSMNPAGLQMIGEADSGCIVGVPYCEAVCDKDRARIADLMRQALAGKFSEFEFQGTAGQYFRSNFVPLLDDQGEVGSLLGITEEITDRKRAEQQIRASEERYRLVARASRDAIWEMDVLTGQVSWKDAYDESFGQRPTEKNDSWDWWTERIREDERERIAQSLREALANPRADHWSADYHFRGADGAELFVQDRAFISRDESGAALRVVGTMRDQTAIERAMKEREDLIRDVQEAQRLESLGILAGGIAHDFNNLLASILANVNLVRTDLGESSPHDEPLHDAESAVERAADLCRQMLAYAGEGRFVMESFDLSAQIDAMMKLLRVSVGKHARLKIDLEKGLPNIRGDQSQISQVIMNLVINASEAIAENDGLITVTTGLCRGDSSAPGAVSILPPTPDQPYVYLDVDDTGSGMDEATLGRMFEPFFTTKFTGRGLGLAAVQGIIRGHRGGLTVKSESGSGTRFRVLLPVSPDAAGAVSKESHADTPGSEKSGGRILLIDDEKAVRVSMRRILEHYGHTVVLAEDGLDGLGQFEARGGAFDLVLLDLTMPRMDGMQTFRKLRELNAQIPVLLMSGHSEYQSLEQFRGLDIAGFLAKPFQASELVKAIDKILAG